MKKSDICKIALHTFDPSNQIRKCMEELCELGVAVCHCFDGKDSVRHVAEEMADVEILLEQMTILFHCRPQLDRQRQLKLESLADKLGLTLDGQQRPTEAIEPDVVCSMSQLHKDIIVQMAQQSMNVSDVVRKLNISRSKADTALFQIKQKTDLDPWNFFDLYELYQMAAGDVSE